MAEELICPMCSKKSYTAAPHSYLPCPYCNNVYSLDGIDKRQHPRVSRNMFFYVILNNKSISANIIDISKKGMRMKVIGSPFISISQPFNIHIPSLDIDSKADIIWQKTHHKDIGFETHFGVRFL